jgi:hypothetical protein
MKPQRDLFAEKGGAMISEDGRYRYSLERVWDAAKPTAVFIMLNPSTADANADDPTIRRCRGFAQALGYGGFVVGNLFAYRATDPGALLDVADPVGPENDATILQLAARGDGRIICAWGTGGALKQRGRAVTLMLRDAGYETMRIGAPTAGGNPRHPLYLPRVAQLEAHR